MINRLKNRMLSARWKGRRIHWSAYVFLMPFLIPFLVIIVAAVFFGIYIAFTEWGIIGKPLWVGLANFQEAFGDQYVAKAFKNTIHYGFVIVPGIAVLGFLFAVYVNQGWPLSGFSRAVFFAPNVVSATVIGLIWVWILDTQYGIINNYLGFLGIEAIPWITSTKWSLYGVSIASIWWDLGIGFVLFLAGLQEIPKEMYDSARIAGANGLQQLRFITLPLMRPTLSMVITLQLIATFRIFSQVLVMTDGGPASSSMSVIHYVYTEGIVIGRLGYASAISFLLFLMIFAVTIIQRILIRERY